MKRKKLKKKIGNIIVDIAENTPAPKAELHGSVYSWNFDEQTKFLKRKRKQLLKLIDDFQEK